MMDIVPSGHIKLARKMFDAEFGDKFWQEDREFSRFEAWVDLIQTAAWRESRFATQYGVIDLARGQFVASRRHLAKRWKWSEKRVRIFVATLEKRAQVRAHRHESAGTVYLIVNYDAYQSNASERLAQEGPAKGPARAQRGPKIEAVKAVRALSTTLGGSDDPLFGAVSGEPDVDVVLDHFLATHPRRRIGKKDRATVRAALKSGYAAADLCAAIDGNAADDWHRDKHKHELTYVLRDAGKIDQFAAAAVRSDEPLVDEWGCLTAYGERVTRPAAWQ